MVILAHMLSPISPSTYTFLVSCHLRTLFYTSASAKTITMLFILTVTAMVFNKAVDIHAKV